MSLRVVLERARRVLWRRGDDEEIMNEFAVFGENHIINFSSVYLFSLKKLANGFLNAPIIKFDYYLNKNYLLNNLNISNF